MEKAVLSNHPLYSSQNTQVNHLWLVQLKDIDVHYIKSLTVAA